MGIAAAVAFAIHAAALLAVIPLVRWAPRGRDEVRPEPLAMAEAPGLSDSIDEAQVVEVIPPDLDEPPPEDAPRIAAHDSDPEVESRREGRVLLRGEGRASGELVRVAPAPHPTAAPPSAPEVAAVRDDDEDDPDQAATSPKEGPASAAAAPPAPVPASGPAPSTQPPRAEPGEPLPVVGVGGGSDDHLPDLPPGADSAVRARRTSLGAFLAQVKGQVRDRWRPSEVYRRVDPTFRLKGEGRYTVLRVRVRRDGSLASTDLHTASGMPALDGEAVRAMEQAQPFPPPPVELLDGQGGISFGFSFYLDVAVASFMTNMRRTILESWKPSGAYRKFGMEDRVTIVRALLTAEGVLAHVSVISPSGLDLLDEGVLAAFKPGMRFPSPPAALGEVAGVIPVRIAFRHSVRGENEVRILHDRRKDNSD